MTLGLLGPWFGSVMSFIILGVFPMLYVLHSSLVSAVIFAPSETGAHKASVFFCAVCSLDSDRRRFFAVFGGPEMRGAAGPSAARRILVHCERVPQKDGLSASRDRRRAGSFVGPFCPC